MKKKIIISALLILGIIVAGGIMKGGTEFLGSSVLGTDTCNNTVLTQKKLIYQQTLYKVQTLDTFLTQNNCTNTQSQNTLCEKFATEKKELEKILQEYDDCRVKLHKSGELVENISSFVPPVGDLKKGEYGFGNPGFTAHGADEYTASRSGDSPVGGNIVGVSFRGGIYRHLEQSNIIIRTYFDGNKEIIDASFLGKLPEKVFNLVEVKEYADGSIYVLYWPYANTYPVIPDRQKIVKLTSNGATDTTFSPVELRRSDYIHLFTNDKKYFGKVNGKYSSIDLETGNISSSDDINVNNPQYGSEIMAILGTQKDGKIVFARLGGIGRLDNDLKADINFAPVLKLTSEGEKKCDLNYTRPTYTMLPDNSLIITGHFTHINGIPRRCIARLTPDGNLDKKFDPGDSFGFPDQNGFINVVPDGQKKLIIQGNFSAYQKNSFSSLGGSQRYFNTVRLNIDGTMDTTFVVKSSDNGVTFNGGTNILALRDGKIITYNFGQSNSIGILIPTQIYQALESKKLDTDGYTDEEVSPQCHQDDYSRGLFRIGNKIYINQRDNGSTWKTSTYIYSTQNALLKTIKRMPNILFTGQSIIGKSRVYTPDENGHVEGEMYETKNDELGGEWSYTNSILIDNRYLYVATRFGIEVIDTQADEVVKLLGHHKPDQSTIENTQLPTDTLTTFQYNGDTYAIGADHIIYKVTGAKKMDIKDKYITITPETQVTGSVLNFMENTERIVQMQKIGEYIYAVGDRRLLVIDPRIHEVVQEMKYDPEPASSFKVTNGINILERSSQFSGGNIIFANNKIYIPAHYVGFFSDPNIPYRSMRWYVFSTATHKLEKILENPASYSDPAGSIKNGLCPPTVPFMIPHGVYTEKNNIYMYIGYKSGACDFVKLDTTTDTFTTIQRPSLNIQRELFLPKNSSSVYQVRGFGKYGDNYFNGGQGVNMFFKSMKMEDVNEEFLQSRLWSPDFIPSGQYGNTYYYGIGSSTQPERGLFVTSLSDVVPECRK